MHDRTLTRIPSMLIIAILLTAACGDSLVNKATKTVSVSLQATNAARDQFVKWDKQHQLDIVEAATTREQAEKGLSSYRAKRQKIVQSFAVAYSSMAGVAAAIPLVVAGKKSPGDLTALLLESLGAVQTATAIFKDLSSAFGDAPKDDAAAAPPPPPAPPLSPVDAGISP